MKGKQRIITAHATSPGIAIGKVKIIAPPKMPPSKTWIRDEDVGNEISRFKKAVDISKKQLIRVQARLNQFKKADQHAILESHKLLLQDDMIIETTLNHMTVEKINAEWALQKTLATLKLSFLSFSEESFKEKTQDLDHISKRIISNLQGGKKPIAEELPSGDWVLVAHDLSPAEIALLPRDKVKGFIMEVGGKTSHSAIIARSLGIPALFGVQNALEMMEDGKDIVIDAAKSVAIVSPNTLDLKRYKSLQSKYDEHEKSLLKNSMFAAETKDGRRINIVANMELIEEVPSVIQHGGEGIGLYRTEYLFLNRIDDPSEDEQIQNYSSVLKELLPHPVVIRTMDMGGDKLPRAKKYVYESNPALGLRSIRLCLRERQLFKTQLRALYRSSIEGNLKILLPLISHIEQINEVRELIKEVQKELDKEKIPYVDVPLGMMIEVPAGVFIADMFAKVVDFFSIGTNDLIQYCLAIDRGNDFVSHLYSPYHPAVIRMLKDIVDKAGLFNIPVSICGELASDPLFMPILLAMGFDTLSMNPASIPFAKKVIRSLSKDDCETILHEILSLTTALEIEDRLNGFLNRPS